MGAREVRAGNMWMAPRPQPFAPQRMPRFSTSIPTGGLAVRVRLLPISGAEKKAILQMKCTLGDVPRERSVAGVRLRLEGDRNEFSEEVGGPVMFLSLRSGASSIAEALERLGSPTLPKKKPTIERRESTVIRKVLSPLFSVTWHAL